MIGVKLYQYLLPQDLFTILIKPNRILVCIQGLLHMPGDGKGKVVSVCHEHENRETLRIERRREIILG
jgi:hypothetical protein